MFGINSSPDSALCPMMIHGLASMPTERYSATNYLPVDILASLYNATGSSVGWFIS